MTNNNNNNKRGGGIPTQRAFGCCKRMAIVRAVKSMDGGANLIDSIQLLISVGSCSFKESFVPLLKNLPFILLAKHMPLKGKIHGAQSTQIWARNPCVLWSGMKSDRISLLFY